MEDQVFKVTHSGILKIGNMEIPCAVLEDGTRVLTQRGLYKALGRSGSTGGLKPTGDAQQLPRFLAPSYLRPFISEDLECASRPILISGKGDRSKRPAYGYRAELLPKICQVFLEARDAGALKPQQAHLGVTADILMRALAHVGIIALVDEATGYQVEREKDELQKILAAYISDALLPWTRRFPQEFYREMFRLKKWPYPVHSGNGAPKGPRYAGKLTRKLVYEQLPPGVLEELERRNPPNEKWQRKHKLFQDLTADIGNPHLEKQVAVVTTLMKVSPNWKVFERNFKRAFPEGPEQMEMFEDED